MIHAIAWLAWVGAILTALSITRNPIYLGLILLEISIVSAVVRPLASRQVALLSPSRFALIVIIFSMLFNALTVHIGQTVLVSLPLFLPLIGGKITLEAMVFGLLNGLVLTGFFAAFTVINQALSIRTLIGLIPRTFYPVAVIIAIAITFVPATLRQWQQIREAQAIRGHQVRGLRDWLPLFLPLFVGGLERSLQLAEAMTARGFVGGTPTTNPIHYRLMILVGLLLIIYGWLLELGWRDAETGLVWIIGGISLIGGTLWWQGRQVKRTTYQTAIWHWQDWLVSLGASIVMLTFLFPWSWFHLQSLYYYPYPKLNPPEFQWAVVLVTLGLTMPAFTLAFAQRQRLS